jgi:ferric-dicitrate binding protein FerR (iron transport regulator)
MLAPVARERVSSYFAPTYEGPVGEVAMIDGLVWVAPRGASEQYPGRRLNVNEVIEAGARIETTAGARVALQLNDGRSVRVDHDTRLHLMDPLTLDLRKGALYVDTGPSESAADSVEIRTALGSVYDIGTQFEVRFSDEALRVRVREGLIHLDRSGEAIEAPAGVELSVDAAGELSRRSVEVYGPIWDWILEIAPPFALEGSTLPTFLAWVSRETGREIRFADEVHAQSASGVVVHGSVEGMRPDSALDAVLPTCDLMHRLDGEVWVLESQLQ